ncbi:efflux RND transporter periplasmic adaptor subunit [Fulvimarina sp. MAC3]|uniref:efflux RND transporter periplasmic adaptor subunit n=1 Tax=Fulvimarina sp. MAC3 TaxID=3148887 RepID=UPI0031FCBDB9
MSERTDRAAGSIRLMAIAFSAFWLSACTPDAAEERPPEPIGFVTAEPETVSQTTTLTGEIVARHTATYSFQTSGRVTDVEVDVGEAVKTGDVLARLDPTQQKADVSAAEAAVASAKAQATQATAAFQRQKELLAKGFTTRANYDDAEKALSAATSGVDTANANLQTANTDLQDTVLRADADGVITSRSIDPGQVVSAAQTAFGFAENGPRDAIFDIQEQLLIHHDKAPEIIVELLNNPSVKTRGTVREISPLIDTTTGTVKVKVGLENTPPEMTLGAAVIGTGTGEIIKDAIIIPWSALMTANDSPAVWVVDAKTGAAQLTPITVGSYRSGIVLVKSGLAAGDKVLTAGSQLVRPGEVPKLVKPDEPIDAAAGGKDDAS